MIAAAIILEAAKENIGIAEAGLRLARDQWRWDEAAGTPPDEQRQRFDEISAATRNLEEQCRTGTT